MAFVTMMTRSAGYVVPASEWNQLIANDNYLKTAVAAQAFLTAGSLKPQATNGCAPLATLTMATNKEDFDYLAFDKDAVEYAQSPLFRMPTDFNGTTFTYNAPWTHPATTTNFKAAWAVDAVAFADDQALETAWGTAVQVNDTGGTTSDLYTTPESAAVTPGGSVAAGCGMKVRVQRVATDGTNDTLAVDGYLLGLQLTYVRN